MAWHSRRSILGHFAAAVATAPIASLPATALPIEDDPTIALAELAIKAWAELEESCQLSSVAEEQVIAWKDRNPRPEMRKAIVGSDNDYVAFQAGLSTYDPNADLDAAAREYDAAVRDWGKLKRAFQRETGYTAAEKERERASEHYNDIAAELIDTRPTSIAGLRAKTNAARICCDDDLQQQIIYDIGVMFGDLDENEKPITVAVQS